MACPTATICDYSRSNTHDRNPIRISHLSNKHLALPKLSNILDIPNDVRRTLRNLIPNTLAKRQNFSFLQELVLLNNIAILLRLNSFRTSLNDVEFMGLTVLCPLQIHRTPSALFHTVMILNNHRPISQHENLSIIQTEFLPIFCRSVNLFNRMRAFISVNYFCCLFTKTLVNQRLKT